MVWYKIISYAKYYNIIYYDIYIMYNSRITRLGDHSTWSCGFHLTQLAWYDPPVQLGQSRTPLRKLLTPKDPSAMAVAGPREMSIAHLWAWCFDKVTRVWIVSPSCLKLGIQTKTTSCTVSIHICFIIFHSFLFVIIVHSYFNLVRIVIWATWLFKKQQEAGTASI